MSQTRLPDWYPDPDDPSMTRWWDGTAWTDMTHPASETPATPAVPMPVLLSPPSEVWHRPHLLAAGLSFLIAGVLAGTQLVYMTAVYSIASFRKQGFGVPISLPFDWYLLLFPYWFSFRAFFSWGLVPPVIILLACSATTLALRQRPRTAMVVIAGCLTLENLLLLIPIFIDSGVPGSGTQTIFMPSQFSTATLAGILIVHVVVWVLPLLFACAAIGTARTRRRMSIVFLIVCSAYVVWYLGSFLIAGTFAAYLLTPGPVGYAGTWIAPVSTALCLAALVVYVLPSLKMANGTT